MLRVAVVSFDFGEYSVRLAGALAHHAEVCLFLPTSEVGAFAEGLPPGVRLVPFAKPRLRQPVRQIRMDAQLLGVLRGFAPDVVHLQQGQLWFNLALPMLRRPLVITVHDARQHPGDRGARNTPQAVTNFGFRRADQWIVHGAHVRELLVSECGLPAQGIHVVPHHALHARETLPREPEPEPDGAPTVLFFGRIWAYKGLDDLIRAQPIVSAEVPDARFVIAGEGEDLAPYRALMQDPACFEIHNAYVPDELRDALFRRAALVVLPYVQASQSGVVPLAYAHGRPVIATTVGGLPEAVAEAETGLLVAPRDVPALAAAIVRLLRDPGERQRLGANGLTRLRGEGSAEVAAERSIAVYRKAIDAAR